MSTLRERVVERTVAFGESALPPLERWLGRNSLVGDQPFFDNDTFPWAGTLEAHWREIRAELDAVLEDQEHLPDSRTSPSTRRR